MDTGWWIPIEGSWDDKTSPRVESGEVTSMRQRRCVALCDPDTAISGVYYTSILWQVLIYNLKNICSNNFIA